ncbi:MAG: GNAT family N-acetyltransferase [Anaerolineales bacterium]
MRIRPALLGHLELCERIDGSYTTSYVWQMEEKRTSHGIAVTFRREHIPRSVRVPYLQDTENLREDWRRNECFLVAQDAGTVVGYLDMIVRRRNWEGWINHLVVEASMRRQGIGSLLLETAQRWARGSELVAITAVFQSKNEPAIQFFSEKGYAFRGFIDQYYSNGDVGLIYSRFLTEDRGTWGYRM